MGFMPIQNIRPGDPYKFEFRWKTARVMVTMVYLLLALSIASMYLYKIALAGITAKNIGKFLVCKFGKLFQDFQHLD